MRPVPGPSPALLCLPATVVRRRCLVRGVVQGVGFRPFVARLATGLGLAGSVRNDGRGVVVEVEGLPAAVAVFARQLRASAPPLAVVEEVRTEELEPRGAAGFAILDSARAGASEGAQVAPDVATCAACLRDLADPANRRHRHPFVSCTDCGPRFTIVTGTPYDRPATTMAGFPMCAACAREYADPADRRFHAQTVCCPRCGPRLELVLPDGPRESGQDALARARRLLAGGAVLAVKGLGGYHLACDADDERAVATLRRRKQRGGKAFAVMVRDLHVARALARVDDVEAGLLSGPARPIVLLSRRADTSLAPSVAPGSPDLGLLLPYTPLHVLLFGLPGDAPGPRALVMTSGNLAGEPIATDDDDAMARLAPLVDGWLRHDRPIAAVCDDSVVRVVDGEVLPLRRSRGEVPLPVALPAAVAPTLAIGGDLKSVCCLAEGRRAWPSQHLGDLDDLATLRALDAAEQRLEALTGVAPALLVADAHPGYRSTAWARRRAGDQPLRTVQHHHAHVAAVMGEHGLDGRAPVLGFAFDGTGYGADGTVWGGEVLVADYAGYRRWACLAPVPLPGGDATIRRPYRMALAHLAASGVGWDDDLPCVAACPPAERDVLAHQLATGLGCVPTSSIGRLFDAVASLAGVRQVVDSEAQAAIELEGLARGVPVPDPPYAFALREPDPAGPLLADAGPVVRGVAGEVRSGVPPALVSARFHAALVQLVRNLAARARDELGLSTVVLAGGVFANALLLGAATRGLREDGFVLLRPRLLPPGDGGLAYGQLLVGARRTTD